MRHIVLLLSFIGLVLQAKTLKVGLVFDKTGRDDRSFNSLAYQGAKDVKEHINTYGLSSDLDKKTFNATSAKRSDKNENINVELKYIDTKDDAELEPSLASLAKEGCGLVIGIGGAAKVPVENVAKQYPKINFLIIDSVVLAPNVRSITFKDHEGSFLVGAIAALTSKSKVIGFVGGMDIPVIRRFELGYKAGAENVVPKVKVISNYVGTTTEAWNNPSKAKELALSQNTKKADIIFAAAGASGSGVFDILAEKNILGIGVDSNQNWIKPGKILTSMVKNVDKAVYQTINDVAEGGFKAGEFSFGLAEKMVDFAYNDYNHLILTETVLKTANALRQKIIDKKIIVPDYLASAPKN